VDGPAGHQPLRVVVADDHPLVLDALSHLVTDAAGLELVGRAASGEDLVEVVADQDPDVVVTDLHMPGVDGIEAIRRLREADPGRRVLVLTMHDEEALVAAALQAGARGYTLKESPPGVVASAIRAVGDGLLVLGPGVTVAPATDTPTATAFPELTPRERAVVDLVAAGRTNLAIARSLGISEKTVRNSLSSILAKLRLADRTTLIDRARAVGIGAPPRY
jgi:DNA-binding NarL/FixJ family response regulator